MRTEQEREQSRARKRVSHQENEVTHPGSREGIGCFWADFEDRFPHASRSLLERSATNPGTTCRASECKSAAAYFAADFVFCAAGGGCASRATAACRRVRYWPWSLPSGTCSS